jgi:ribosomal 30S subunit maturation factor RimM
MERIRIGIITKPQALKGEFRLKPDLLNLKEYKKISSIFINNKEYLVERVSLRDTFVIMKVEGVERCEDAEVLRGKEVFADMEIKYEETFDLQAYDVFVSDNNIGKVVDINNYGSKDILSIKGTQSIMLPVIDGLITEVFDDEKKVVLNQDLFEQVAVYED